MTHRGSKRTRRLARVPITFLLLLVLAIWAAAPPGANAQPPSQADAADAARLARAMTTFNSANQPESIPMFSEIVDSLRSRPNRTPAATRVLIEALLYRAQARFNLGQNTEADADLTQIRALSPAFRITDQAISRELVARYDRMVGYLQLTLSPADARVVIDGLVVAVGADPIPLAPGQKTLVVDKLDYLSETRQIQIVAGQTAVQQISLSKISGDSFVPPRRIVFGINRGYTAFQEQSDSAYSYPLYRETANVSTFYKVDEGFNQYDFGGAVRLVGALAVGVNYSTTKSTTVGSVDGRFPHPIILNAHRSLFVEIQDLTREERVWHLEIRATRGGRRGEAAVFVGPSFFDVRHEIVSNIVFRELTNAVVFTSATTKEILEESVRGFNVGADFAAMIVPYVGFGGFVRYGVATKEFVSGRDTGTLVLGGLQMGGGVRLRF